MAEKTTHHVMPMLSVGNTDNYISGAHPEISSRCATRSGVRNKRMHLVCTSSQTKRHGEVRKGTPKRSYEETISIVYRMPT